MLQKKYLYYWVLEVKCDPVLKFIFEHA
ncbi:hypothetical protein Godav_003574 [Gossypium davidsonii]|uniref:Uncharacterized protein n=1 Tax=Gossypium davidsonii TaxID=34287 RepID=A0A7J8SI71_GOSDV|nr:hypothetical protein [Gossypium davidsonii]